MKRTLSPWLGAVAASLLPLPALAITLVNQTSGTLQLQSPLHADGVALSAGQAFPLPGHWGDDRHLYLEIRGAGGAALCGNLQDRYGTVKLPTHPAAVLVSDTADCALSDSVPEIAPAPETPEDPQEPEPADPPPSDPPDEPTVDPAPTPPVVDRGFPPRGNGTWVYDATFPNGASGQPHTRAGIWAAELRAYNGAATETHRFHQIFSYGGDLEMECLGGSDCTPEKMHVYYYPPTSQSPHRSFEDTGSSGFVSTQAYADGDPLVTVVPVFDGRFDAGGYLQEFETLDESQARTYADIFARTVCADPAIAGVQLDLEPFDMGVASQVHFYDQLASNLAGQNEALEPIFGCTSERHPQGRFFSVFTFANQITPELGEIFTRHENGVVIVSLYDLGPGPATEASLPADYQDYVANEIARTVSNSRAASDVPFQFGIPAAASTKEFESYKGRASGHRQVDYVNAALDALDASGVRTHERFLGIAVWGWSREMAWPPHSGDIFEPGHPTPDVLDVLAERL